jgi:hypothetical protein
MATLAVHYPNVMALLARVAAREALQA